MTLNVHEVLTSSLDFISRPVVGVYLAPSAAALCAARGLDLLHALRNSPPYDKPIGLEFISAQGKPVSTSLSGLRLRFHLLEDLCSIPVRVSQLPTPNQDHEIATGYASRYKSVLGSLVDQPLVSLAEAYLSAGSMYPGSIHDFLDNPLAYLSVCAFTDTLQDKVQAIRRITADLPVPLRGAIAGLNDNDVCCALLIVDDHQTDRSAQYVDSLLRKELSGYNVYPFYLNLQLYHTYQLEPATAVDVEAYLRLRHPGLYRHYLFSCDPASCEPYASLSASGRRYGYPYLDPDIPGLSRTVSGLFNTIVAFYISTLLGPFLSAKLYHISEACLEYLAVGRKIANFFTGQANQSRAALKVGHSAGHLSKGKAHYARFGAAQITRRFADLLLQLGLADEACSMYAAILHKSKGKMPGAFMAHLYEARSLGIMCRAAFSPGSKPSSTLPLTSDDRQDITKTVEKMLAALDEAIPDPTQTTPTSAHTPRHTSELYNSSLSASVSQFSTAIGMGGGMGMGFGNRVTHHRFLGFKRRTELLAVSLFLLLNESLEKIVNRLAVEELRSYETALSFLAASYVAEDRNCINTMINLRTHAGETFFEVRAYSFCIRTFEHVLNQEIDQRWWFKSVAQLLLMFCYARPFIRAGDVDSTPSEPFEVALERIRSCVCAQTENRLFSGMEDGLLRHFPQFFAPGSSIQRALSALKPFLIREGIGTPTLMSIFLLPYQSAHPFSEKRLRFCKKNDAPLRRYYNETPVQYAVRIFRDYLYATDEATEVTECLRQAFIPARKFTPRAFLVDLLDLLGTDLGRERERPEIKLQGISLQDLYHPNISLPSMVAYEDEDSRSQNAELILALRHRLYARHSQVGSSDKLTGVKAMRAGEAAVAIFCLALEYPLASYDLKKIELLFTLRDESDGPISPASLDFSTRHQLRFPIKMPFSSGSILLCGIPLQLPKAVGKTKSVRIQGLQIQYLKELGEGESSKTKDTVDCISSDICLDTPITFPVLDSTAELPIEHALPEGPFFPGEVIQGRLLLHNVGHRDVSEVFITSNYQGYCAYDVTGEYLDGTSTPSPTQRNPRDSLFAAYDYIFADLAAFQGELQHVQASTSFQSLLRTDLARPYLHHCLQRHILGSTLPECLQDRVLAVHRVIKAKETVDVPFYFVVPALPPGTTILTLEHVVAYAANGWPIVSDSLVTLRIEERPQPAVSLTTTLAATEGMVATHVDVTLEGTGPMIVAAALDTSFLVQETVTGTLQDGKVRFVIPRLGDDYHLTITNLSSASEEFNPTTKNVIHLPNRPTETKAIVRSPHCTIPEGILKQLHQNALLLEARHLLLQHTPTIVPALYAILKRESAFVFKDRNDEAYDLALLHSQILGDLKAVQKAVLGTYTGRYGSIPSSSLITLVQEGGKTYMAVPRQTRDVGAGTTTKLEGTIVCVENRHDSAQFRLVLLNQTLESVTSTVETNLSCSEGAIPCSMVGLVRLPLTIPPVSVWEGTFHGCAASPGSFMLSARIFGCFDEVTCQDIQMVVTLV
ncbi:hypothetical protein GMRT_12880 [Giardia muris]|uniref:Uncharacterized protein n=1 Tax=Giardia muris TaxID=5742 RepID=A0A4Z1T571_GIAMU|nr:hypothetical protein GMRT_12880 [Giardia muris]|eukprot:TNJ27601.1 hypothetical protein GMRT_12880 [Giardia muris]